MKDWQLSGGFGLWLVLILGCLSTITMQPGWAETKLGSGELAVESRDSKPILTPKIRNLREIQFPSTSAQMLVQSPAPQNPPLEGGKQGGEIVPITGVKANPTDKGVEVILQTTQGKQLQVINRSTGNSFIVDIPNAQLRLPLCITLKVPLAGIRCILVRHLRFWGQFRYSFDCNWGKLYHETTQITLLCLPDRISRSCGESHARFFGKAQSKWSEKHIKSINSDEQFVPFATRLRQLVESPEREKQCYNRGLKPLSS